MLDSTHHMRQKFLKHCVFPKKRQDFAINTGHCYKHHQITLLHMYTTNGYIDFNAWHYMGRNTRKPVFGVCEQHRHRPACASAQSDQHLCYSLFGKYHM